MKARFALLSALMVLSIFTFASHRSITGASLTYEYVGNNRFVFEVQLTVNCQDSAASWGNLSLVNGTTLFLDTIIALDSTCAGAGPCFVSGSSFSRTFLVILRSSPQTIAKPSAGTPHVFEFDLTGERYAPTSNLDVGSVHLPGVIGVEMHAAGYPRSSVQTTFIGGDYRVAGTNVEMLMPFYHPLSDSTYSSLVSSRSNSGPIPYVAPLSGSSPVPGTTYDANVGNVKSSGLTSGTRYFITQEARSYYNGQVSSVVRWDRGFIAFSSWPGSSTVDVQVLSSSSSNMTVDTTAVYINAHVLHGDTLRIDLRAATTGGVGIGFTSTSSASGPSAPTVQPKQGFNNPTFLPQIDFEYVWAPDSLSPSQNRTTVYVQNDACPPIRKVIVIDVITDDPVIPTDTIRGCAGEVVTLPTPLVAGTAPNWSPDKLVVCGPTTGCTTVLLNDTLLEYYVDGYVTHRVYLEVISIPRPVISTTTGDITVQNGNDWSNFEWYQFGVRVPNQSNGILTGAPWGLYQERSTYLSTSCQRSSNVVGVNMPQSLLSTFNRGSFVSDTAQLAMGDTISYLVEKDGPLTVWPQSVIIPGINLNSTMEMRVYRGGNLEFTSVGQDLNGMAVEFDLPHNGSGANVLWRAFDTLRFVFEVTSGTQIIPAGDTVINNSVYGDVRMRRCTRIPGSSQLMPIVIRTYPGVGLEEAEVSSWKLYPNPSTGIITIEGSEEGASWSVLDLMGRELMTGKLEGDELNLTELNTGFYFIRIGQQTEKVQILR